MQNSCHLGGGLTVEKHPLTFRKYQQEAQKTDQFEEGEFSKLIPWVSLSEEAGVILRIYKDWMTYSDNKYIQENLKKELKEKLGHILWYASNLATKFDLELAEIAAENLVNARKRWSPDIGGQPLRDSRAREDEQLPRLMKFYFTQVDDAAGKKVVIAVLDENGNKLQVGDRLDDNSKHDDGYRFHDVFHLAYAAHLGWSPVIRSLLRRKRKSNADLDRIEDGARAQGLEEGITAQIFQEAKEQNFFEGITRLNTHLLKNIRKITRDLEVENCSLKQWETAILEGYQVFRDLRKKQGGTVEVDLRQHTIKLL